MNKEELIRIFDESESIAEICRVLYGKNNGGMHNRVLKLFKELNYDWDSHILRLEENKRKYCLCCGKEIIGKERKRRKFCSQSCAVKYNNKLREVKSKEKPPKKLKRINNVSDEEKWEKYCKRYNQDVTFEYFLQNIKDSSHDIYKRKKRCREQRYCIVCGKELSGAQTTFCSNECRNKSEQEAYEKYIERWKKGEELGLRGSYQVHRYIKRYLFEKYNNSCQECGWSVVNKYTNNVPLQVHHIDGDCTNNKEENLQLLCPNCHSLTENFGSRNKNSKRLSRRKNFLNKESNVYR